jgi:endonuclease/exonuclease/phosphatase family metal-dependent hydrolase
MAAVQLRVLTWNLMHGRSIPPARRELFDEFASALESWDWDVALLQEVPPWWPAALGDRMRADQRMVLTSRNALPAARRALAVRWPDLIKSNGGGANVTAVQGDVVVEHRVRRLSWLPERRWVQAVRLSNGLWVGNVHTAADASQGRAAALTVLDWAGRAPVVLGGDFNVYRPSLPGLVRAGGHGVDQVFVDRRLVGKGETVVLERGSLSDHAPVLVRVMLSPEPAAGRGVGWPKNATRRHV